MDYEILKDKIVNFGEKKSNDQNRLFWRTGIFKGADVTHFFFEIEGEIKGYARENISRIEVK